MPWKCWDWNSETTTHVDFNIKNGKFSFIQILNLVGNTKSWHAAGRTMFLPNWVLQQLADIRGIWDQNLGRDWGIFELPEEWVVFQVWSIGYADAVQNFVSLPGVVFFPVSVVAFLFQVQSVQRDQLSQVTTLSNVEIRYHNNIDSKFWTCQSIMGGLWSGSLRSGCWSCARMS